MALAGARAQLALAGASSTQLGRRYKIERMLSLATTSRLGFAILGIGSERQRRHRVVSERSNAAIPHAGRSRNCSRAWFCLGVIGRPGYVYLGLSGLTVGWCILSRECIQIWDKGQAMIGKNSSLQSRIYGRITASTPSAVWTIGDFADFGSRDAISKALQRLEAAGNLRRIDPGLYDRPRTNQLTGKPTAPDYRAVIDAIARRDRARILIDGMTAANDLGLSEAVPGRVVVHSDTRLRPLQLGNLIITFRPTSARRLYWAGRPAMRVVQALHWLKRKLDNPEESQRIRRRIEALLSDPKQGTALRKDLQNGLQTLPVWMQEFLRDMPSNKSHNRPKSAPRKPVVKRQKAPAA